VRKHTLAAVALPLAALLHPITAPAAHACCGGAQPPTPAQRKFIADAHSEGLPGVDATSEVMPDGGKADVGDWPGLNVRDSNVLYAGVAICTALEVPSLDNAESWKRIYWLLGEPYDVPGTHTKIIQATQYARTDLGC
jgi:hypothetical protein